MPIEIRELVIRAIVDSGERGNARQQQRETRDNADDRQAIVTECVAQVLEILRQKTER